MKLPQEDDRGTCPGCGMLEGPVRACDVRPRPATVRATTTEAR